MARQVAGPTYAAVSASRLFADNGSTGAQAALTIAPQATPTDALEAGNIWVDSTSKALVIYDGAAAQPVSQRVINREYLAASVDNTLFIADRAYTVVGVRAVNTVAGTGGAANLDIKKCTGTQAPSAGTTMLTGTLDLTTTAHTVITGTLTTGAVLTLAAGDRIGGDFTGTLTSLVGMVELFLNPA